MNLRLSGPFSVGDSEARMLRQEHIRWFDEIGLDDGPEVGGKTATASRHEAEEAAGALPTAAQ
ncbi:MAG TPA: hypothetical protein VNF04_02225 [Stellaceae bacterium]|nr:hypothetical protein [Stellaceae bacterium]